MTAPKDNDSVEAMKIVFYIAVAAIFIVAAVTENFLGAILLVGIVTFVLVGIWKNMTT